MSDAAKSSAAMWVRRWKAASHRLQSLRDQQLREVDTTKALMTLAPAFEAALRNHPPRPTSGLVEQQAYFERLRKAAA